MEESILASTKKLLGVGADDESFDLDILMHINSAFSNLHQLGIGPDAGFAIVDDTTEWVEFGVEKLPILGLLKSYIYLKVRMLFDPPSTPYHISALERQTAEIEWRLSSLREETDWVDPDPEPITEEDLFEGTLPIIIEGGGA